MLARRLCLVVVMSCAFLSAATTAVPATTPLSLKERLATTSEFPAYKRYRVVVIKSPVEWAHANAFINSQTLRQFGFVAAAIANLQTIAVQRRAETSLVSAIVQFRSTAGAAAYRDAFLSHPSSRYKPFAVPGIPHGYGFAYPQPGGGFYEVVFVDGPFFYDLIAFMIDPAQHSPTASQTAAAATRWYSRVRGRPPS
jgi:hypothetical protein